ncbi:unnamed protein product [Thlaspi arvense]|uniref:SAM-dependent MTase DRM-type domain-containing protein n=1 Tax=Thlaspi arvense TaxID=13288 RepID=A0AAU9SB31_THLAR|nr:unnamed protein product [Thlaspi arvense]
MEELINYIIALQLAQEAAPVRTWELAQEAAPVRTWEVLGDGGSSSGTATANVGEKSKSKGKGIKIKEKKASPDFVDRGKKRQRPRHVGGSSSMMETPRMQDEPGHVGGSSSMMVTPRMQDGPGHVGGSSSMMVTPRMMQYEPGHVGGSRSMMVTSRMMQYEPGHVGGSGLMMVTPRMMQYDPGHVGDSSSMMLTPRMQYESKRRASEFPSVMQPSLSRRRPYFFYANLGELSFEWRCKVSKFLFEIQQVNVDTSMFSGFHRKEVYVHDLPTENRCGILTQPKLSMFDEKNPEKLEYLMGYPPYHTAGVKLAERLKLLDYCFQTDTLGYHISGIKAQFPDGVRLLSLFSGVGGAEIALSRLRIHLRCVVSVEHCGLSRNILKRWWQTSRQTGELVQIEDIASVRTKTLEDLVERFGGFDLIICQNPPAPADLSEGSSGTKACAFQYLLFQECVRIIRRARDVMEL